MLASLELWGEKDASAIISLYCLIITSEARAPALLSLSFRLVHQQPCFDIHAAKIEMRKDVPLTPRSPSLSLPAHFHLHHPFTPP